VSEDRTPPPDQTDAQERRLRGLLRMTAGAAPRGDVQAALSAVRRRRHRRRIARVSTAGVAAAGVAAAALVAVATGGTGSPSTPTIGPYRLTGALVSFPGCGAYLHYVRHRASRLVGPYGLGGSNVIATDGVLQGKYLGYPVPAFAAAAGDAHVAVVHSTTTDQVAGVDEPDTVKADGRRVVTLTGSMLRVLDNNAHVLGSLRIDGDTGGGLLLAGDRVVVLSSGDGLPVPFGIGYARTGPLVSATAPTARAAVVDLSDPAHPRLVRTFLVDGTVVAARLIDGRVQLVLRSDAPQLDFQTPSASVSTRAATVENRRLVATSTINDWLPGWQVQAPDGSATAWHRLARCDAVARPKDASGLATVSVVSLDPGSTTLEPATSLIAAGDTVYATAGHLYVAGLTVTRQQREPQTRIYDFATGSGPPRFVAAGSVPGTLLDSYSLDENVAGQLRVVTTTTNRHGHTGSRLTVLAATNRKLRAVGRLAGLGHGQQVRAVRFLGDTAYVVTFRSFDPLYVIDLSDPQDPHVSGTLEQPGYSEFLYPLGAGRLLGVGVRIRHNEPSRLVATTYDVSDPASPRRVDEVELAKGFQASIGAFDPHAFLSWPAAKLAVVAVPNGRGAVAVRIGSAGTLSRLATLNHGRLSPSRTLVVGSNVWAVNTTGVIVSPLPDLNTAGWRPY
jgi:hypothetical protein